MLLRTVSLNKHGLLGHDADLRAQRGDGHVAHIMPVNQEPARGQVEEAGQQMNERALPGAAGADDGKHFPGLHFQVDGAQDVAIAFALVSV